MCQRQLLGHLPEAWQAMHLANADHALPYGDDLWTERASQLFWDLFKKDCEESLRVIIEAPARFSVVQEHVNEYGNPFTGVGIRLRMKSSGRVRMPSEHHHSGGSCQLSGLDICELADTPSCRQIWPHPRHPAQRIQHSQKTLRLLRCNRLQKNLHWVIEIASNPRIFLSAGEASGDHYGAQLIAELRTRLPHMTAFGLGGKEMEAVGQDRIVRAEDVAHMGITEVLRHAPRVYGSYRRLVASIKKRRPDVAVLIDFPDVNLRLARELRKLNIPVVYFVSPQLWAWKRKRLRWVQQRVTRMMVIFPFEENFYRARNVEAEFVGHPLAYPPTPTVSREDYAQQHGLNSNKHWIALLPGSRAKEVKLNLPTMLDAAATLGNEYEYIVPVASTLRRLWVEQLLSASEQMLERTGHKWPCIIHLVPDAREALHHARASIVASGTATVQAAVIGNPFVVVYKVSPFTFAIAKRLVQYPPEIWPPGDLDDHGNLPIGMVNLIAGRRIVPEVIQEQFAAPNLIAALKPLLADTPERTRMIADLSDVRRRLAPASALTPIQRVAGAVEALLRQSTAPDGRIPTANV